MTRAERIRKLVRSIKDYRGAYIEGTGRWIVKPNPAAWERVAVWLETLRIPVTRETRFAIDSFQNLTEMQDWIKQHDPLPTPETRGSL